MCGEVHTDVWVLWEGHDDGGKLGTRSKCVDSRDSMFVLPHVIDVNYITACCLAVTEGYFSLMITGVCDLSRMTRHANRPVKRVSECERHHRLRTPNSLTMCDVGYQHPSCVDEIVQQNV